MPVTAGTTSAAFAVSLVVGALVVSSCGFLDVVRRPSLAYRTAHVSKHRWLLTLGLSATTLLVSSLCLLLIAPASVLLGLDAIACMVGLVGGAWYLAIVRPWVAAHIRGARAKAPGG